MSTLVQIAQYVPTVRDPEREQKLKQMLIWTGIVLLLYFAMSEIPLWTAGAENADTAVESLRTFETLLGSSTGTLITLGIGPIVTASIVLQMLVGSELLSWNTDSQEGKQKFQAAQKLLAYGLTVIQAAGFAFSGTFGPPTEIIGSIAGISIPVGLLLTLQMSIGGWLIILLDDLIQKWGFGSGVGLFIAAGVSKAIFVQLFSPLTDTGALYFMSGGDPQGAFFTFITTLAPEAALTIVSTVIVFAVCVYLQAMRVEIPLTFGNVRGFGQKWPLKFFYTSVMPVIFVSALTANVQIIGTVLAGQNGSVPILGTFSQGQPQSGLALLLNPPSNFLSTLITGGFGSITSFQVGHALFYVTFYTVGAAIFSIFWARTTGQDSDAVAEQIQDTGMKVPGFRKDKRVIKKVLERYIPPLVVVAGASVGFIAAITNLSGAASSGTSILLVVMILYRLYEQLAQKHMEELHPALKDFF
ncbi:MAG: preprotein translocase subunit SecY [Candidatus Nanohaloarchaea archaeon]